MPSRPHDMRSPRDMPDAPNVEISRAGVPTMDPPKRCCWIIVSSKGPHARPEMKPPVNAAATFSPSASGLAAPPVMSLATAPVSGNCSPVSVAMFTTLVDRPRYSSRGLSDSGRPCCVAFFQYKIGCSAMTSMVPAPTPMAAFSTGLILSSACSGSTGIFAKRTRCLLSRISSRRAGRTSDWSAWDPVSTEVERQRFRLLVEEQKNEQAPNPAAFALPAGGLRARRPGDDGKPGRRRTAAGSRRRSAWATRWRPAPAPRNRPTSRKGR
mmetsp:Transcript_29802/g.92200  ORF Transcript_29802/g.92200 Transcript_29802/m.92200 type:complete len:268 (-) Transcript_29802:172-975(-)